MTQSSTRTRLQLAALGIALATVGSAVHAQTATTQSARMSTASTYDMNRTSWIPYTRSGYIGLNGGRSDFGAGCGALALRCENSDTSGHLYLGGYFNPYVGAEIGYIDFGNIDRAGGRTSAHGVTLSLIGRAPLAERFSVYGKLGATYSRTRVSAVAGSGIVTGRENGWGPSYALGVNYDLTNNWSAVVEINRQRLEYAGNNNDWVRTTSVGLQYHF